MADKGKRGLSSMKNYMLYFQRQWEIKESRRKMLPSKPNLTFPLSDFT